MTKTTTTSIKAWQILHSNTSVFGTRTVWFSQWTHKYMNRGNTSNSVRLVYVTLTQTNHHHKSYTDQWVVISKCNSIRTIIILRAFDFCLLLLVSPFIFFLFSSVHLFLNCYFTAVTYWFFWHDWFVLLTIIHNTSQNKGWTSEICVTVLKYIYQHQQFTFTARFFFFFFMNNKVSGCIFFYPKDL